MYANTANANNVMIQSQGGVPIPMQAGSLQTVTLGTQGSQPQMVMCPVSGAEGYQPWLVHVAPAGAMVTCYQPQMALVPVSGAKGHQVHLLQVAPTGAMATGYKPQQAEMPPSYEEAQNLAQANGQR